MKKLITTLQNIWKIKDLRERILFTLLILAVYRFGCFVVLPGVDAGKLAAATQSGGGGLLDLINAFSGGAFLGAAVFALGIMPYITASIIIQLLGFAVPYFQRLQQREGESGRKKITQITRWLTVAICLVQGSGYLTYLDSQGAIATAMENQKTLFYFANLIILTTGTVFAMWLGEKITDKGIGNGISLLIMVGIIATLPKNFLLNASTRLETNSVMLILFEIVIWLAIILASVMLVMAVRKIAVQYARRNASGGYEKNVFGSRQYIPLKLNASGVMPIIFAQALMFAPATIGSVFGTSSIGQWLQASFSDIFGLWYNILFGLLVVIFTFFYTAITVPTNKMSDDLKRSGGFVPGIRPGNETSEFLDSVMSLITFPGSLYLAVIAIFPAIVVQLIGMQQGWALFFGGTSLLIMVGVAIDTIQQVNAYLLKKHYDGLMKSGSMRSKPTI